MKNMQLNIQKWGNSAAVRLPVTLMAQLGAKIGDTLDVDITALRVAKPRYSLAELLAQCDPNAPMPADLAAWDAMPAVGREVV